MSTKTQTAHSPYFSRFGFKAAPKPPPRTPTQDDDDWYTPYNGPYEIPSTLPQQQATDRARDSWGQVLNSAMDHEAVLPGPELAQRHHTGEPSNGGGASGGGDWNEGHKGRAQRGRAATIASGRTDRRTATSPKAVSPHQRSPPASNANRHPHAHVSSFVNLDPAGGVGESPMPVQRNHHSQSAPPNPPPSTPNRLSLASFLTFGNSVRKLTVSVPERPPADEPAASQSGSRPSTPLSGSLRRRRSKRTRAAQEHSQGNNAEDDYYNSYYSTLLSTPQTTDPPAAARLRANTTATPRPHIEPPGLPSPHAHAQPALHPYAYPFPSSPAELSPTESPRRAPIISILHNQSYNLKGKAVDRQPLYQYPRPPPMSAFASTTPIPGKSGLRHSLLKAISTPNLQGLARSQGASPRPQPKPKQRWLSPETWCDALLFPRPRFALHVEDAGAVPRASEKGGGRIVSPPASPIAAWTIKAGEASEPWRDARIADDYTPTERPAVNMSGNAYAAKSILKSRSATNLSTIVSEAEESRSPPPAMPMYLTPTPADGKKERPRSFAHDDLSLPSPVPSLAKVLEAGETLDRERKAWQTAATHSFTNKISRSMGRARSKSVGQARGARLKDPRDHGNLDFLAARTLLGSQAVAPKVHVVPAASAAGSGSSHSRSHSRGKSHGHSNSVTATMSSRSHGETANSHAHSHSRNESWGRSALRTATGLCVSTEGMSPSEEPKSTFDTSIREADTKVVHLNEQMLRERMASEGSAAVSASTALAMMGGHGGGGHMPPPTPTPSGMTISAEGFPVGIALSSPPPSTEEHSHAPDAPFMSDHPYAQGGFSGYSSQQQQQQHEYHRGHGHHKSGSTQYRGSDYAGPHPSSPHIAITPAAATNDVALRHRLPPHAILHPYAQGATQRDREPELPMDIAPERTDRRDAGFGHAYAAGNRNSGEPLGLGDALAYALMRRGSIDSGLGASEEHAHVSPPSVGPLLPPSAQPRRGGRRPGINHLSSSGGTNHTLASTPPDQLNPPFFRTVSSTNATRGSEDSPALTLGSGSSSPQPLPHTFSSAEDLTRFQDLFYRPAPSRMPSDEQARDVLELERERDQTASGSVPVDVVSRHSGLMSLRRQLSEELEALAGEADADADYAAGDPVESPTHMWGRRYGGLRGERPPESVLDPNMVLSLAAASQSPTTLPLRLHREQGHSPPAPPAVNVPEDVRSSRGSSILEREMEDVEHDQVLRLGSIEASSTPAAETAHQRFSAHILLDDLSRRDSEDLPRPSEDSSALAASSQQRVRSHTSSLVPPRSATDLTRSSYMTTSTNSRMSGLSDFPAPPEQLMVTPAQVSLLNSYFGDAAPTRSGTFGDLADVFPQQAALP